MNGLIKGLLITAAVAGVGACGHFGYKAINNKNKEINNLKTENAQLKEDNETKSKEITSLKNDLMDKNTSLVNLQGAYSDLLTKYSKLVDVEIPRIQNELATKTSLLETANGQISTLNTQKVSLLNAVTEIDNVINETEDAVEIENLEARKNAILVQIDSLNTQISSLESEKQALQTEVDNLKVEKQNLQTEIANLQTQKTQLENEIASLNTQIADLRTALSQLENTTGIEFKVASKQGFLHLNDNLIVVNFFDRAISLEDYLSNVGFTQIGDTSVDACSLSSGSEIKTNFSGIYTGEISTVSFGLETHNHYEFTLNGTARHCEESTGNTTVDKELSNLKIYYNGVICENLNAIDDNKQYLINGVVSGDDICIYINDNFLTGKYVSKIGEIYDFDNNFKEFEGVQTTFVCNYVCRNGNGLSIGFIDSSNNVSIFDMVYDSTNKAITSISGISVTKQEG